jgi:lipid-binding SYLF domain-containing protein
LALGVLALGASAASAASNLTEGDQKVLREAPGVLKDLVSAPDDGIPQELLERSECVMVFPSVTKGAFIVGGKHGRGVATCRVGAGMSPPAFFEISGPSIGWQFGGEQTDLVLLVMNPSGMEHLLKDKITLGGEATAAVGPVGRKASAATDLQLQAQILSWSRSRGLFLGASLEGAALHPDKDANRRLYGKDAQISKVLRGEGYSMPQAGAEIARVTGQMTRRAGVSEKQDKSGNN